MQGRTLECTHRNLEKELKFDPAKDGELSAAERLTNGAVGWDKPWQRFADNPSAFPGIPELLRRVEPEQMGLALGGIQDLSRWPSHNDARELEVLEALQSLGSKPHNEACRCVRDLENQHRERRGWIWARLGLSPMAQLLEPLGLLAQRADQPLVGTPLKTSSRPTQPMAGKQTSPPGRRWIWPAQPMKMWCAKR